MTNAELAILSLVAEKPCYGYEIEQIIEQRGMREWTEIQFSSIYYLLKKLEGKKLITGRLRSNPSGPARKVYRITEQGQAALYEGALEALRVPAPTPRPILLGFSVMPMFEFKQFHEQLAYYYGKLARQQNILKEKQANQKPPQRHVNMMFEYSLAMIVAEMELIARLLENYETMYGYQSKWRDIIQREVSGESND
jgi:DNA-binding PadR family transcriptional regulator